VLVGDAHQLAPVKARGGMFAQLCADLPWTQKLSEVWRMHDPEERAASLAIRDGGPAPVRRAVEWYRAHDRLHTGDDIAMAADALRAYHADVAAGKDALLIADTVEMCDALNRRIHDQTIDADAVTVTAARGQRIAEGDVIISRRNDPTNPVHDAADFATMADPVRNGQRWQVYAVDPDHQRIAARRLDDGARAAFTGDYLREHVHQGYAVTVHSAQGVTAETTHAVLGETTTRNLLYVALTRGRESNNAYLYERQAGETEHDTPENLSPVCIWRAAVPPATPLPSCATSSAPATSKPAPPTTSPPKPKTANNSPSPCSSCWRGERRPCEADTAPTGKGSTPPTTKSSNSNASSTNTSAAAANKTNNSTTAWNFKSGDEGGISQSPRAASASAAAAAVAVSPLFSVRTRH